MALYITRTVGTCLRIFGNLQGLCDQLRRHKLTGARCTAIGPSILPSFERYKLNPLLP